MRRAKITVVGAGHVGATTAHWCAAAELGYIDLKTNEKLGATCEETSKALNGLIRSLRQ